MRFTEAAAMVRFLWKATRGHRFRPWASPYLRWRIETYWGWPADTVDFGRFWNFMWTRQRELWRFLRWVGEMESKQGLGKCRAHNRQPK
ncbi:MAG: hypothetical protein OXB98_17625 [Bryobacterales bacterium]|nr:hypothetical protein [Bryobacterales bacterium]